jgi:hypothetical protein
MAKFPVSNATATSSNIYNSLFTCWSLVILASDVWNIVLPLNTLKNIFLKLKYVIIQDDEKDVQPIKLQNTYQYTALHIKDFYGGCPKECCMFSTLTSFHNAWCRMFLITYTTCFTKGGYWTKYCWLILHLRLREGTAKIILVFQNRTENEESVQQ